MDQTPTEQLDRLTKIVTLAGGIGDEDFERISTSPFLNTRLRARIDSERKRQAGQTSGWFATLLVASRAMAVLLAVTIAAALAFWLSRSTASPPPNPEADNVSRIVSGGTCALSSTEECAISTDDVLATLFAENGGK